VGDELGTILVTGGASGLGAAVVDAVSARGGTPVVMDRVAVDGVDHEIVDLIDTRAAECTVERITARHPDLAGVVSCAGTDVPGSLLDVSGVTWDRVVTVNLLATAAVVRAALPALIASHGRIVTVASTLGLRVACDATAYCASKFGVVGFSRALAAELAGRVGVTLLIPGGMATSFFDDRAEQYRPPASAALSPPERVADAVLFALSQPAGVEVRELVVCSATESSWP